MTARTFITIKAACARIGGDKPISPATYYRGVKRGLFPAPEHPSPGISRIDQEKLDDSLRDDALAQAGQAR